MKNKFLIALLMVFGCFQVVVAQEEGSTTNTHLTVPLSARTASLGNTVTGGVNGGNVIEALQSNPAGLSSNGGTSALFSRMNYVADIGTNYFGFAQKVGNGNVAVTINSWDFGDIVRQTESSPEPVDDVTWNANNLTIGVTYARQMTDRFSAGLTVKSASQTIDNMSSSTIAVDAGATYVVGESGLRFGVVLSNFGGKSKFTGSGLSRRADNPTQPGNAAQTNFAIETQDYELPSSLSFGATYTKNLSGDMSASVLGNFRSNNNEAPHYGAGLEFGFKNLFFLRGGYEMSGKADNSMFTGANFGAGLNLNLSGTQISVDYAMRMVQYFDTAPQLITVGVKL